jgi:hypothetical protein
MTSLAGGQGMTSHSANEDFGDDGRRQCRESPEPPSVMRTIMSNNETGHSNEKQRQRRWLGLPSAVFHWISREIRQEVVHLATSVSAVESEVSAIAVNGHMASF